MNCLFLNTKKWFIPLSSLIWIEWQFYFIEIEHNKIYNVRFTRLNMSLKRLTKTLSILQTMRKAHKEHYFFENISNKMASQPDWAKKLCLLCVNNKKSDFCVDRNVQGFKNIDLFQLIIPFLNRQFGSYVQFSPLKGLWFSWVGMYYMCSVIYQHLQTLKIISW